MDEGKRTRFGLGTAARGLWGSDTSWSCQLVAIVLALLIWPSSAAAKEVRIVVDEIQVGEFECGGLIVCGGTATSVPGAAITVNGDFIGETDSEGEITFDLDSDASVDINIAAEGFEDWVLTGVDLSALEVPKLNVNLRRLRDIEESEPRANESLVEIGALDLRVSSKFRFDPPEGLVPGLFQRFQEPVRANRDATGEANWILAGDQQLAHGRFFELDDQSYLEANGDGTFTRRLSLLDQFFPSRLTIHYDPDRADLEAFAEKLSGSLSDGIQRLEGDRIVYPDSANGVHRVFQGTNFEGNLLFPSDQFHVGPASGGFQFQAVQCEDTTVVFASYTDDLSSQPVTKRLSYRATLYDEQREIFGDLELAKWQGEFQGGVNRPFAANVKCFGDGIVGVAYQSPEGTLELSIVNLAADRGPDRLVFQETLEHLPPDLIDSIFNVSLQVNRPSGAASMGVPGGATYLVTTDGLSIGSDPEKLELTKDPVFPNANVVHFQAITPRRVKFEIGYNFPAPLDHDPDPSASDSLLGVDQAGVTGASVLRTIPLPGCVASSTNLCLNDQRFAVSARFRTRQGAEGEARAKALSNDSGTFWFFGEDNRELIVKALDGCGINGHYWLFGAGLTDVEVVLQAHDAYTGSARLYVNPLGRAFEPVLDIEAFPCTEAEQARALELAELQRLGALDLPLIGDDSIAQDSLAQDSLAQDSALTSAAKADGTACGGKATDLCLNNGRFRVEVDYTDFAGKTAPAFGGNLTDDTGALFFFDRSNVELLIKVLDGCFLGSYWVFAAGLTNVGVDITVTDTVSGEQQKYNNPVGSDFRAITDTSNFRVCS